MALKLSGKGKGALWASGHLGSCPKLAVSACRGPQFIAEQGSEALTRRALTLLGVSTDLGSSLIYRSTRMREGEPENIGLAAVRSRALALWPLTSACLSHRPLHGLVLSVPGGLLNTGLGWLETTVAPAFPTPLTLGWLFVSTATLAFSVLLREHAVLH